MHYVRISRMTDSEWVQLRCLNFSTGYFFNQTKMKQLVVSFFVLSKLIMVKNDQIWSFFHLPIKLHTTTFHYFMERKCPYIWGGEVVLKSPKTPLYNI